MQDFVTLSNQTIEFLRKALDCQLCMVTRVEGDNWVVLSVADSEYGVRPGSVFRWPDGLCSRMVAGLGPHIAPDVQAIPAYVAAPVMQDLNIGCYSGVPIRRNDGSLFGTLCAISPQAKPGNIVDHLDLMRLLADMLGCVLNGELTLAATQRELERATEEAAKDALTGLYNRRGWSAMLQAEEIRCARYGNPACVISIDIDDLKLANDRRGHAFGDKLICGAAKAIRTASRTADIVARTGGDEFMVLGIECAEAEAHVMTERLRHCLLEANIKASLGLAMRVPDTGLVLACEMADQAMYREKYLRKKAANWPMPAAMHAASGTFAVAMRG